MRSTSARLPLSRYPLLDVRALDEVPIPYGRVAPLRLHGMTSSQPFSLRIHHLALGPLALCATDASATLHAECEGASDAYLLSIPLGAASAESTSGRDVTPVVRGRSGVIDEPWRDVRVTSAADYRGLQLSIPRAVLRDALATLTGREAREPETERRFALDAPRAESFLRLLAHVLKEADRERPAFAAPGASEQLAESLLFRFLLAQPRPFATGPRAAEPRHVRRAAEYLEANHERPTTMAELTRLTGVGARALQLGFAKHRGCTPLAFVRARRLERARVLLLTDDTVGSVSEAARRAGLEHLGRFSVRYRARFGESPRRTLARRWRV